MDGQQTTEASATRGLGKERDVHLPFIPHGLIVGSAPPHGVTQEVMWPSLEGEQEQSGDDCLEADCSAPLIHYEP